MTTRLGRYGLVPDRSLSDPLTAPKAKVAQSAQIAPGSKISARRLAEGDARTFRALDGLVSRNVIVGVPAAFAPNCDAHPPGYIRAYEQFRARGVSDIFVVALNDAFVMDAWKRHLAPEGTAVHFVSDTDGSFVADLGLLYHDAPLRSVRAKRFVILMEDTQVQYVAVEDDPCAITCTSADALLAYLDGRVGRYVRETGVQFEAIPS
ncbi:hypothetical protein HWV62_31941 [Athelia sp. TMB]|nr:hypothetical protein HWV62_31941 [Athelia sp. TMB]